MAIKEFKIEILSNIKHSTRYKMKKWIIKNLDSILLYGIFAFGIISGLMMVAIIYFMCQYAKH